MTDNEKNLSPGATPPVLVWKRDTMYPNVNTYRAEAHGWKFTIDQPYKGSWHTRGWDPSGSLSFYRDAKTLKQSKRFVEDLVCLADEVPGAQKDSTQDAAVPVLTWTPKKGWGTANSTHHAQSHGWNFTCDQPQRGGDWVVRGWGPDDRFIHGLGKTLKVVKQLAESRLVAYLAERYSVFEVDTQCVNASGHTYPEHDYDEVTCRRCGVDPND